MAVRIDNLKLRPGESEEKLLRLAAAKARGCRYFRILRKSLDARDKANIRWVYSVEADTKPFPEPMPNVAPVSKRPRVVVVGSGPAGLFCAVWLTLAGVRPLVVERGGTVEERVQKNNNFFARHELDENCNVQFGEGGAGTFSDGKLNTQTHGPLNRDVLNLFVHFGAPPEIAYLNKPHIGSDRLRVVVKNIRNFIEENGGEVRFHTLFGGVVSAEGRCKAVRLRDLQAGTEYEQAADEVVLAIGHSSRDTFAALEADGFAMEPREFAVGVRIEHLQEKVNIAQYSVTHTLLPPADYKLVSRGERTAFTFCMCPGGVVIPAASEYGGVVTNGMSDYARDGQNANSALLVQVRREDFDRGGLLDGVEFQRKLERAAFAAAGGCYAAPVQRSGDFFAGRETNRFGDVRPTYAAGVVSLDLNRLLPSYVSNALKRAIQDMDTRLRGFADPDAVLTAPETRFSSPVRILRGESLESLRVRGVYPCGEGCGYSGGITSSAADGLRVAQKICEKYR